MTITIYEDNAGGLHISDGTTMWCSLRSSITLDQAQDAAQAWESGEWEPNEVDGWQLSLQKMIRYE